MKPETCCTYAFVCPSSTELDSVKLARLVFNRLFEVCCSWLKDFPYRRRPQPYYETSIHAIKNMRRKMEDKHVIIPTSIRSSTFRSARDQEEQAFFAVFDGHGGVDAAIYAANHLHVNLVRHEFFKQDPIEALFRAFRITDERFIKKAAREKVRCGTTGVVTFLRGRTLYVAWLGDSQVMLVRKGQAVELMKPHKPDREDEKQRIEALGGCDAEHKPYICGDPDHSVFPLDGSEDYLILACDGFWDTVSPDEAVRVVSDHLQENAGDTSMVAHKLVASARDAGSSDNITAIVVFLRDPRHPRAGSTEEEEEEVAAAVAEEGVEEEEAAAEVEEEEEEEEQQEGDSAGSQRGGGQGGSNVDVGGKSRGGWPLQQCSAPADLAYEDRMDSFTDRTSLSLLGPAPGGWTTVPPIAEGQLPTGLGHEPACGSEAVFSYGREESHLGPRVQPRPRPCVPGCQDPVSPAFTNLLPCRRQRLPVAGMFGQPRRHTRRRLGGGSRRSWRGAGRTQREPSDLQQSCQSSLSPARCPEQRPGVALPHLPLHDARHI
ncbi:hypothetical protein CRUP_030549 [Coryphaenoides rupestris]|nr:hypothetical protein CRUP_030549 [Coryphaenoides rupestris]